MELISKKVSIQSSDRAIFDMLINCNNIGKYIPADKIQNWQSTENNCSFSVEGAGKIEIEIQEKIPYNSVSYSMGNKMIKAAFVVFSICKTDENVCELTATTNIDAPFFITQMIKPSMQRFADMLVDYIKIAAEQNLS